MHFWHYNVDGRYIHIHLTWIVFLQLDPNWFQTLVHCPTIGDSPAVMETLAENYRRKEEKLFNCRLKENLSPWAANFDTFEEWN